MPLHPRLSSSLLILCIVFNKSVNGFHLTTSISSARPEQNEAMRRSSWTRAHTASNNPITGDGDPFPLPGMKISDNLIAQLAIIAIKLRLADHSDVSCQVKSKSADLLLRGRVGPVTVKGKGWRSERGLSCQAIEATVSTCELDIQQIISSRKLKLVVPSQGKCIVGFSSEDFGNFLIHPLLRPPKLPSSAKPLQFLRESSTIDSQAGTVTFRALHDGDEWLCILSRGQVDGERAVLDVRRAVVGDDENGEVSLRDSRADEIRHSLTKFFNNLVFDLDGTVLSFRDMMLTDKGTAPTVMIALNILVRKFPSPSKIAF